MGLQRSIFDDNTGVSPVIGVILMVAVTVIIAAVIGSTALSLGDSVSESPPQATFAVERVDDHTVFDDNPDEDLAFPLMVSVTHSGGEDINQEQIQVTVDGEPVYTHGPKIKEISDVNDNSKDHPALAVPWDDKDTISSGDTTDLLVTGDFVADNGFVSEPIDTDPMYYRAGPTPQDIVHEDEDSGDKTDLAEIQNVPLEDGQTLRIVWESGDQSQTLLEEEI